jgi:hypothetical protein
MRRYKNIDTFKHKENYMAFCINCGSQNADGIKFCTSCGKPLTGGAGPSPSTGAASGTAKVGNVRKCPACGAAIESFQTRCSSCGHELNSVRVAGSIQAFVRKLEKATTYTEMREMIEAFPIPNSKEDIFEFAILAVTKIKPEGSKTNSAWQTKLKQVYLKAQLAFENDAESLEKLKGMIDESESIGGKIADMQGASRSGSNKAASWGAKFFKHAKN